MSHDWMSDQRDLLLERVHGRIDVPKSLWPTKGQPQRVGCFAWHWRVLDVDDQGQLVVLDSGTKVTERWAWHAMDAAAKRIHDKRAEAQR